MGNRVRLLTSRSNNDEIFRARISGGKIYRNKSLGREGVALEDVDMKNESVSRGTAGQGSRKAREHIHNSFANRLY